MMSLPSHTAHLLLLLTVVAQKLHNAAAFSASRKWNSARSTFYAGPRQLLSTSSNNRRRLFSTASDEDLETKISKQEDSTSSISGGQHQEQHHNHSPKTSNSSKTVLDLQNLAVKQMPTLQKEADLLEVGSEHSLWYRRLSKDIVDSKQEMTDQDFVLVSKEAVEMDPALNLMASEIGVKEVVGNVPVDFPVEILTARAMDTAEDIWQIIRRVPFEKGTKTLSPEEEATRKTVIILGSGWGAHALMKIADCNKLRLIVVSPSNHFVFTPMLASAAVGTVEYRSMTEAVRSANPMISEYIEGKATHVNVKGKKVTVQLNQLLEGVCEGTPPILELDYDHLVVSVGCKVDDKGVPGADKALRLKSCDDARRLRTAVGECFEYASRPDVSHNDKLEERTRRATFLIVGGGATGVELAGELHDLAEDITRPVKGTYPRLSGHVRVILVHSGPDLVPQFEQNLRDEALKALKRAGVQVVLNTRVMEVADRSVKLSTKIFDEHTGEIIGRDESTLPVGLTVWCAGTAPVSFVDRLLHQLPKSARNIDGRIKVDKWMRPDTNEESELGSVLVLGDAAAFPDKSMVGDLLPQTAQVAGQQGAYVARMLNRGYDLQTMPPVLPNKPVAGDSSDVFTDPMLRDWLELRGMHVASTFSFLNLGLLAYLGGGEALSQVQIGDVPIFKYGGSVAFILWRSVYLVKQVATKNRVLVTFDWIKSALFGRDMTRL